MTDKPNINGKRMNKLEEIIKLLQKLNEDLYTTEQLEANGYQFTITLKADGSGVIEQHDYPETLYNFCCLGELEEFLKADTLHKLTAIRCDVQFNSVKGKR